MLQIDLSDYRCLVESLGAYLVEEHSEGGFLIPLYLTRLNLAKTPEDRLRVIRDLAETLELMMPVAEVIELSSDEEIPAMSAAWVFGGLYPLLGYYLAHLYLNRKPVSRKQLMDEMKCLKSELDPLLAAVLKANVQFDTECEYSWIFSFFKEKNREKPDSKNIGDSVK